MSPAHEVFWRDASHEAKAQVYALSHLEDVDLELEPDFLGFLDEYMALASVIPKDRVIYDIGCYCAVQAWFFREHQAYVGIDESIPVHARYHAPNVVHVLADYREWLKTVEIDRVYFAIANYCPSAQSMADLAPLRHGFVFYPHPRIPLFPR